MKKFWELFEQSVILQGMLTVGIWGVLLYMIATGSTIPPMLENASSLILGFYFGSKLAQIENRVRTEINNKRR